jgi:FlaG/FlaF family flagellin (archaellin)
MKNKKMRNKKAVSLVLSYALLILIAFSLAAGVYIWIENQVPEEIEACPDGVSVIIRDSECYTSPQNITVVVANKGRFDIHGLIVRAKDNPDSGFISLTENDNKLTPIGAVNQVVDSLGNDDPLEPDEEDNYEFTYQNILTSAPIEIQVGAGRLQDGDIYVCTNTFVSTPVSCS